MISKSKQKARPFILIASEDKASREEAKTAIDRSGILSSNNSSFKLWLLRHLPTGPVSVVATTNQSSSEPHQRVSRVSLKLRTSLAFLCGSTQLRTSLLLNRLHTSFLLNRLHTNLLPNQLRTSFLLNLYQRVL